MKTTCNYCGGDLVGEIVAIEGMLFCDKDCAILHKQDTIIAAANDEVTEWFEAGAETVLASDIGIEQSEHKDWTAYAKAEDVTIIFRNTLDEKGHVTGTKILGWYSGSPDAEKTELNKGRGEIQ